MKNLLLIALSTWMYDVIYTESVYKVYALSVGDFNMLIRLAIQIIYISWNRNVNFEWVFNLKID